ncbi:hypothetical protein BSLG_001949 [Batrachochytrium salamandrivorans]|nr:hypothetical protein BSLG_001949 [Batrachochytrium salamandrivorans]
MASVKRSARTVAAAVRCSTSINSKAGLSGLSSNSINPSNSNSSSSSTTTTTTAITASSRSLRHRTTAMACVASALSLPGSSVTSRNSNDNGSGAGTGSRTGSRTGTGTGTGAADVRRSVAGLSAALASLASTDRLDNCEQQDSSLQAIQQQRQLMASNTPKLTGHAMDTMNNASTTTAVKPKFIAPPTPPHAASEVDDLQTVAIETASLYTRDDHEMKTSTSSRSEPLSPLLLNAVTTSNHSASTTTHTPARSSFRSSSKFRSDSNSSPKTRTRTRIRASAQSTNIDTMNSTAMVSTLIAAPAAAPSRTRHCQYCGTSTTPMWRHGPAGTDPLCNRCGVKWKRGRILTPGVTPKQIPISAEALALLNSSNSISGSTATDNSAISTDALVAAAATCNRKSSALTDISSAKPDPISRPTSKRRRIATTLTRSRKEETSPLSSKKPFQSSPPDLLPNLGNLHETTFPLPTSSSLLSRVSLPSSDSTSLHRGSLTSTSLGLRTGSGPDRWLAPLRSTNPLSHIQQHIPITPRSIMNDRSFSSSASKMSTLSDLPILLDHTELTDISTSDTCCSSASFLSSSPLLSGHSDSPTIAADESLLDYFLPPACITDTAVANAQNPLMGATRSDQASIITEAMDAGAIVSSSSSNSSNHDYVFIKPHTLMKRARPMALGTSRSKGQAKLGNVYGCARMIKYPQMKSLRRRVSTPVGLSSIPAQDLFGSREMDIDSDRDRGAPNTAVGSGSRSMVVSDDDDHHHHHHLATAATVAAAVAVVAAKPMIERIRDTTSPTRRRAYLQHHLETSSLPRAALLMCLLGPSVVDEVQHALLCGRDAVVDVADLDDRTWHAVCELCGDLAVNI